MPVFAVAGRPVIAYIYVWRPSWVDLIIAVQTASRATGAEVRQVHRDARGWVR
jgi:hypothetical protein